MKILGIGNALVDVILFLENESLFLNCNPYLIEGIAG